ncbi:MAG: DUF438 domain-containing protein [Acidobacteriota bacterium]
MSELIDNRRHRMEALKRIIHELHDGAPAESVKDRFRSILEGVGAGEVGALESELIAEGMPVEEVRRMCDVHAAVFRDHLEQKTRSEETAGHPVHTLQRDNQAIVAAVAAYRDAIGAFPGGDAKLAPGGIAAWRAAHERLTRVEGHYLRKEYLVFPFLEKAGIAGPPKVMWRVHDEIRERLKAAGEAAASAGEATGDDLALIRDAVLEPLLAEIEAMTDKEARFLFPMVAENLSESDWGAVQAQWGEFPPSLVEPEGEWRPRPAAAPERTAEVPPDDAVRLPSGHLTLRQLTAMLDALPLDITFVDADDRVAYFSEGRDRVFARNRAIIGRRVQDCHPPSSVHIVQGILDEMRAGTREVAEFWISLGPRFVHIRYFAVRDGAGAYLGCVEATQDVAAIRALQGERRLLAEGGAA